MLEGEKTLRLEFLDQSERLVSMWLKTVDERDALAEWVETLEAAMSEACLRLDASGICRVRVVPAMDILHKALEAGQSVPV